MGCTMEPDVAWGWSGAAPRGRGPEEGWCSSFSVPGWGIGWDWDWSRYHLKHDQFPAHKILQHRNRYTDHWVSLSIWLYIHTHWIASSSCDYSENIALTFVHLFKDVGLLQKTPLGSGLQLFWCDFPVGLLSWTWSWPLLPPPGKGFDFWPLFGPDMA